jgi:energy-converting hydrogenase A subunit M
MSTVGYGDVNPSNMNERIYLIFVMAFGVVVFTFFSGSLSSMMQSIDDRALAQSEDLNRLKKIKNSYRLKNDLFIKVRQDFFKKEKSPNQDLCWLMDSLEGTNVKT